MRFTPCISVLLLLLSAPAHAQLSLQDVMDKAVKNPDSNPSCDTQVLTTRPQQVWQRVQSDQLYGTRLAAGFMIEEHDASDIDLLEVTDEDGVIDVNKIPDRPSPSSTYFTLEDLQNMGPCCPIGGGWSRAATFCQRGTWKDINRDGRMQENEHIIELFEEGQKNPKTGECRVGRKLQ